MDNQHLTSQHFSDSLNPLQLQHIAECDYCCEAFAEYIEAHTLVTAPHELKSAVLNNVKPLLRTSYRLQLFKYSLRVGVATLGAFFLLCISPNISPVLSEKVHTLREYDHLQDIATHFNHFTFQLFKTEDYPNDQKEK